jgi:16S rRNA (cytosine1402-N4)-methyltransferase
MLEGIRPVPGGVYLDGTLGGGGYAEAILDGSGPDGILVGLDLDAGAIARSRGRLERFGDRFVPVHGGFHESREILEARGLKGIDGAVLDLGLSSDQLDDSDRGFSFQARGPLDMRFDTGSGESLTDLLQRVSIKELETILLTYGEERYYRRVARSILTAVDKGLLENTGDLARVVAAAVRGRRGKIHPATRTFQALRIAVNRELENLDKALADIPDLLNPGGRFCVVSYHSLEDRRVKTSFREKKPFSDKWRVLTPKPIRAGAEEVRANPRARSARLRILEKTGREARPGS